MGRSGGRRKDGEDEPMKKLCSSRSSAVSALPVNTLSEACCALAVVHEAGARRGRYSA